MGMLIAGFIEYARLIEKIDAYLAGGMDNTFGVEHHAHMDNMSVLVAEEGQVAGLNLREEIHQFAFLNLLRRVAWKELACGTGAKLHKTAAVDAKNASATP